MTSSKHCHVGLAFTLAAFLLMRAVSMAAPSIACDSGNGGLTLPAGFCAIVVANDLGAARHATVAPNGDLYVALQAGGPDQPGGAVALRDADGDGDLKSKKNSVTAA
jgi:hypothetical protein